MNGCVVLSAVWHTTLKMSVTAMTLSNKRKNAILAEANRYSPPGVDGKPLFSYWKSTSYFWYFIRRFFSYDGHRGQVWVEGEIDNLYDYWSEMNPLPTTHKLKLFVSKNTHNAIRKHFPDLCYGMEIIETDGDKDYIHDWE